MRGSRLIAPTLVAVAALVIALIGPVTSASADDTIVVPAGADLFATDPQHTQMTFQGPTLLPADFFGPGSQPFEGTVKFCGESLGSFGGRYSGDADTVIRRSGDATLPAPGSSSTVPIEITQLNLVSCQPVVVQVGSETQSWDVRMGTSALVPSQGSMTIRRDNAGGTFDAQLPVVPMFTFAQVGGANTRVLDFGEMIHNLPPIAAGQLTASLQVAAKGGPWAPGCQLPALRIAGENEVFCPGLNPQRKKVLLVFMGLALSIAWDVVQPEVEHFACYGATQIRSRFRPRRVALRDQFGARKGRIVRPERLCNPAQKNDERFVNRDVHLKCYRFQGPAGASRIAVTRDQFGSHSLRVREPRALCVPTLKRLLRDGKRVTLRGQPDPLLVDNYLCYRVKPLNRSQGRSVALKDQFRRFRAVVGQPVQLCNPVEVNGTASNHTLQHLTCYRIATRRSIARKARVVQTANAFGREVLRVSDPGILCVPGDKVLAPA